MQSQEQWLVEFFAPCAPAPAVLYATAAGNRHTALEGVAFCLQD